MRRQICVQAACAQRDGRALVGLVESDGLDLGHRQSEPDLCLHGLLERVQDAEHAASASTLDEGRSLYLLLGCWRCHGVNGAGRGPSAATLTDDDERPIRSTDLRHDPFKGGRDTQAVVRTLLTGLNGSPMPAYGGAMLIAADDDV